MKRKTLIAVTLLTVMLLTACTVNPGNSSLPDGNNDSGAKPQNTSDTVNTSQTGIDTSAFIGEERAKQIALERAEITSDGVFFDKVELDRDDGIWQYEIEFRKDGVEYEADIKADDGTILSWDADYDG